MFNTLAGDFNIRDIVCIYHILHLKCSTSITKRTFFSEAPTQLSYIERSVDSKPVVTQISRFLT